MRRLSPVLTLAVIACLSAAALAQAAVRIKPSWIYRGHTTQGIAVRLGAESRGARVFRYQATMSCNDGQSFTDDAFTDTVTIRRDRFSSAYTSDAGAVSSKVTGVLSGARASGTVRIVERYSELAVNGYDPLSASGAIVCDSKTVKWSARA